MIGERLGKWLISKELGRGGMGRVYLATEEMSDRKAAIKVLAAELATDPGFLVRFQREIETLSKLTHPKIVRFYEAGFENNLYFYAMEYVEGQPLDEVLASQGRMHWEEVLDVAIQICPALRHVHDHGIIHRDIKPPNILRTTGGEIKLMDFGIAKVFASGHLTATGGIVGTAEFLSPEQASGKPVGKRSDLYSLGVVLYTLLTGRTPFEGQSIVDLLHKHRYAQFERPGKIVQNLPYDIDDIVCQLLEKDPDKRPPDCLVLGRQLDAIRKKLERKGQVTRVEGADGATVSDNKSSLSRELDIGPATLMSKLMRAELEEQQRGNLLSRLLNRAWVLFLLLGLCVGVIVWTFWPASAESLFHRGAKLMESGVYYDMKVAWDDYLGPLNQRYPNHPYQEEVKQFEAKYAAARNPTPRDAQRFLVRGDRLLEEGRVKDAMDVLQAIVQGFSANEADRVWVNQAKQKLRELEKAGTSKDRWDRLRPTLEQAEKLRDAGRRAEAQQIWSALESLYKDDPFATDLLNEIAQARKK